MFKVYCTCHNCESVFTLLFENEEHYNNSVPEYCVVCGEQDDLDIDFT